MDRKIKVLIDRAYAMAIFHTLSWAQQQIEELGEKEGLERIRQERDIYYKKRWKLEDPLYEGESK